MGIWTSLNEIKRATEAILAGKYKRKDDEHKTSGFTYFSGGILRCLLC